MPIDLFSKTPLPQELPEEMKMTINELSRSASQEECLKKAYAVMTARFHGLRGTTYFLFWRLFIKDAAKLWKQKGFMQCTNLNYLMRILLVKSGFFSEEDIELKWTAIWYFSPHQYLRIRLGGKFVNIDIWGRHAGIEFGDYTHGFH